MEEMKTIVAAWCVAVAFFASVFMPPHLVLPFIAIPMALVAFLLSQMLAGLRDGYYED
jgi:hypothetical protein